MCPEGECGGESADAGFSPSAIADGAGISIGIGSAGLGSTSIGGAGAGSVAAGSSTAGGTATAAGTAAGGGAGVAGFGAGLFAGGIALGAGAAHVTFEMLRVSHEARRRLAEREAGRLKVENAFQPDGGFRPPPVGPPRPDRDGPLHRILYHYTDRPESDFANGMWSGTHVTDTRSLTAREAIEQLGVQVRPTRIIPVIDRDYFQPASPFIVPPHRNGPGGGRDYINRVRVPSKDILPAIPIPDDPFD